MDAGQVVGRVFTTYCQGIARVLENEVKICAAHDPNHPPAGIEHRQFVAIWDTGATNTVITSEVVRACGLKPVGMTQVAGVHSVEHCNTYLVNIVLRNDVEISPVPVTEAKALNGTADVLIGMDLISMGDFAVSTFEGRTVFTFRMPSAGHINFLPPGQRLQLPSLAPVQHPAPKVGRNDPCPCGSGKKYKKCHGASE